jgi:hypothetical protein
LVLFQQKERHGRWGACKQDMKRAATTSRDWRHHGGSPSLRRRKEAASPSAHLGANAIQICGVLKILVTFGGCSFSCLTSTYAKWFEGARNWRKVKFSLIKTSSQSNQVILIGIEDWSVKTFQGN